MKSRSLLHSVLFLSGVTAVVAVVALTGPKTSPSVPPTPQSAAAAPPAQMPAVSGKSIAWNTSFEDAMRQAKEENKPVMLDFYTDWCGVCKTMDKETYSDSSVIAETENFIPVKINAEQRTDLAQAYGITGYPTIIWIKNDGRPISTLPGFAPPTEFLQMMRSALTEYQQKSNGQSA